MVLSQRADIAGDALVRQDWSTALSKAYFRLDVTSHCRKAGPGQITKKVYAELGFTRLVLPYLRVRRTPALIAHDRVEEFCIVFVKNGKCDCRQRDSDLLTGSGGMYMVNASEPYEVYHSRGAEIVCLIIPCDLIRPYVPGIDDMILEHARADRTIANTLEHFVVNAVEADRVSTETRVQALCFDMIALMLTSAKRRH